jgi:1-acyl-sn-glycerol-3-phosphate acyltransferase
MSSINWIFLSLSILTIWFVYSWLVRKCEAANVADWGNRWLNRLDGLTRIFCRYYHRLNFDPIPLPEQGSALVISNHISGLDPMIMVAAARRPLRFMIAREQYQRLGLQWLFRAIGCIPVDRDRRPEQALRDAIRALENGEVVALFPHGRIHIDESAPPKLKGGVVRLAQKTNSMIYPVRVAGIKGKGHVILGVLLRSHARVTTYEPISCEGENHSDCLARVAEILHGYALNQNSSTENRLAQDRQHHV